MQDWQKRILKEKEELSDKIDKLNSFIVDSVVYEVQPDEDKELLWKQLCAMREYENILAERIIRF